MFLMQNHTQSRGNKALRPRKEKNDCKFKSWPDHPKKLGTGNNSPAPSKDNGIQQGGVYGNEKKIFQRDNGRLRSIVTSHYLFLGWDVF